jgi:SAM-dependent methyltransferase
LLYPSWPLVASPYYKPILSPLARLVRRVSHPWLYRGTGVHCPICEQSFRAFVGGPLGHCPGCRSAARTRLLWLYLRSDWAEIFAKRLGVLHIAPDQALESRFRKERDLRYLSGDPYEPEGMIRLDLTDLALPDGCFDVVLCVHVLPHIPNDRKAMHEMARVLRTGGAALIMAPVDDARETTFEDPWVVDPKVRTEVFGEFDFVRVYGRDFYDRLRGAGFDVSVVRPAEKFDEPTLQTYGLWNERIFVCRRIPCGGSA